MKTVNLANVNLSPKWFLWAIVAFVVVLAAYGIATWLFNKVKGVSAGATSKITGTAGGSW